MNQEYKTILRDIVELFYHSPFKIFNINTVDGETMVKPFGYFISLGITTSLESLRQICDYIGKSDYGFDARIVEICSLRSDKYGDHLNMLLQTPEDKITKYISDTPSDDVQLLDKDEATEFLREFQGQIQEGNFEISPVLQKLRETMDKIGDDWDTKVIQIKEGLPSIFHRFVNYRKEGDLEYRIGIYATKL